MQRQIQRLMSRQRHRLDLRRITAIRTISGTNQVLEEPRVNLLGIQYLSEKLHKRVFPKNPPKNYLKSQKNVLLDISKKHLAESGLLGKKTQINEPINIENFPNLVGNNSLDEHFFKIGSMASEPYLTMCNELFSSESELPPKPSKWVFKPGWYRYEFDKEPEPVKYPLEKEVVFDVEVMYKRSPYPVLATAVTPKAWYGWVSPALTEYNPKKPDKIDWEHLIPMNTLKEDKLVVGYNVSYDRARILEEYSIQQSKAFYLDGMSLHIAVSGLCTNQRPLWHKHKKLSSKKSDDTNNDTNFNEPIIDDLVNNKTFSNDTDQLNQDLVDDPWLTKGSPNSLANVAEFHCGIKMDKSARDAFETLDPNDITNNFNNLMDYCSGDVIATFEVTKKLFPVYKEKVPHPVSFAALRHLGTLILPTTKRWETYTETAESIYQENRDSVTNILKNRVTELILFIEQNNESLKPDYENDPWLKQLDWTIKQPRLKKNGEPAAKQAFLVGYPEWYRELFKLSNDSKTGEKTKDINISVRSRVTPLLLRLKWEGYTLFWTESNGWCFKVPFNEKIYEELDGKGYIKAKLTEEENDAHYEELNPEDGSIYELFKVPHPEGNNKRCTAIMSKSYSQFFQNGVLTSEYSHAQEILDLNSTASYWMGNRGRILDQFVVYSDPKSKKNSFFSDKKEVAVRPEMGLIIPKLITMGTITRRAVENTWLTASNAKKTRIGSELKSLVEAPKGYTFVGADVDSEELWIAALIGDSIFKIHGATALSWMTLEGDKNQKTDLHSKTADILGISRGDAKVFNYGRIYGAGVRFATRLLKQCNNKLSDEEAEVMAKKLYQETKGTIGNSKLFKRRLYHGGTESVMFNALESIAHMDDPRTPVLGASITDALTAKNLNKNNYLTSRTNWAIQSSGVDYLHLLIISMDYLIKKYKLQARLMITVHDELRYLVREEDRYKIALLLQISNLWTRAMFAERLGFNELPQSVAFFSEVDIDKVLRKEVTLDCTTPSQPDPIPPGESLDIFKLLELTDNGKILNPIRSSAQTDEEDIVSKELRFKSNPQIIEKITEGLDEESKTMKLKLEMSATKDEFRKNLYEYAKVHKSRNYNYVGGPEHEGEKIDSHMVLKPGRKRKKKEDDDISSKGDIEFEAYLSASGDTTKKSTINKVISSSKNKTPDQQSNRQLPKRHQPLFGTLRLSKKTSGEEIDMGLFDTKSSAQETFKVSTRNNLDALATDSISTNYMGRSSSDAFEAKDTSQMVDDHIADRRPQLKATAGDTMALLKTATPSDRRSSSDYGEYESIKMIPTQRRNRLRVNAALKNI